MNCFVLNGLLGVITLLDFQIDSNDPWNIFVDAACNGTIENVPENLKDLYHPFWYDAEVNNGGHLQYFLNESGDHSAACIDALRKLGLTSFALLLSDAARAFQENGDPPPDTVEEYVDSALSDAYESFDEAFYKTTPELSKHLMSIVIERSA